MRQFARICTSSTRANGTPSGLAALTVSRSSARVRYVRTRVVGTRRGVRCGSLGVVGREPRRLCVGTGSIGARRSAVHLHDPAVPDEGC